MDVVLLFVILILFLVVPVMLAARLVKAKKTGFIPAMVAVVLLTGLFTGLEMLALSEWLTMLIAALVGAGVFVVALGTSLLRGFLISVIVVALQAAMLYLLFGVWLGSGAA